MKTTILQLICLASAMLTSTTATFATPISIEFGGIISQFGFDRWRPGQDPDPSMTVGAPFQVILNYDDAALDTAPSSYELGRYSGSGSPSMLITSGSTSFTMSTLALRIWIFDGSSDGFVAQWDGLDARIDGSWATQPLWGDGALRLVDPSGSALSSDTPPSDISLANWTGEKSFRAMAGNGYGQFELRGDITSAKRVPETLPTGLALAFASSMLMALRRHLS